VLLAAVSLIAIGHGSDALAACSGVDTGSVLCDAANPSGGSLSTTFSGATTVDINAGAGITAFAGARIIAGSGGDLVFTNNDPAGISSSRLFGAVSLSNQGTGGVFYTGSADVVGGIDAVTNGGPVSIRQTAGTVTASGTAINVFNTSFPTGSVNLNTVGSHIVATGTGIGIFIQTRGSQNDVNITTGAVSASTSGAAILVRAGSPVLGGGDLTFTSQGPVTGSVTLQNSGLGAVSAVVNGEMNTTLSAFTDNSANAAPVTLTVNQDIRGSVTAYSFGTGTVTVHTRGAAVVGASSHGANNSLIVDGNVATSTVAGFGGASDSAVGFNFNGSGNQTAAINGAVSANMTSSSPGNIFATGISAWLGSTSSGGIVGFTASGPVTSTGTSAPGSSVTVTGVQTASTGVAPASFNLGGAVSATANGDSSPNVIGVGARMLGLGDHTLNVDGSVTATANGADGRATGILGHTFFSERTRRAPAR
jgi:hypothetical protein